MKKEVLKGVYHAHEKGFGFVKVEDQEEEVFISAKENGKALNEDTVLVKIIQPKTEEKSAEGKIIKIVEHGKTKVVGTLQKGQNFGFVVPDDKSFGSDIFISKTKFGKAKNKQKVVVELTKFPEKNKKAEGKIVEVIGKISDPGVDMMSLIREYDLPYEFPKEVLKEIKYISNEVEKKDIPNRVDFRQEEIFTIDGEDAKDLDDAVCVKKLENGNYQLGVHIADVSHYVEENSQLDQEAIKRGTSVYMMDRVIPMLPPELSNGICSLNAKEDRFTISIIMEIDQQGKVVSSEIAKGIINVTKRMTYHMVSDILEENKQALKENAPYIEHFKRMKELSNILKEKRNDQGFLDLDIPESKIVLDKDGVCIDVQKYEPTPANEIIEQFMITANEQIAERFYWLEAPFIYRTHEVPDYEKIQELNKFLVNFHYKIKGSKENIYPRAFSEVLEEVKGKPEEKVVSNLILRTLRIAKYENENKGHFGLASKYYCHFTSPIRRYPDLFIHRIISYYLKHQYQMEDCKKEMYQNLAKEYAQTSSIAERTAQKAERDSEDMKKAEYMQGKIGEIYQGIISSVTQFGIFVELENTIEGLIRFEYLGAEYYIYDEEHKTLIGEHTKETFKIGDTIQIQVIAADKQARRIDFARVVEE